MENNPLIIASHTTPTGDMLSITPGAEPDTLHLAIISGSIRADALLPIYEVRPLIEDLAHDSTVTVARVAYPELEPLVVLEEVGSQKYLRVCLYLPQENLLKPVEVRVAWRAARCLALAVREYLLARATMALLLWQGSSPTALLGMPSTPVSEPEPVPPAPRGRRVSDMQRQTIFDLYAALHPGKNVEAGVETLFQREVGYSLENATYDEGRRISALLLKQKREGATAPPPATPTKEPAPAPSPPTPTLTRDEALATGKQAVANIVAQLRPTMPRSGNKMVAATFRALTNAIRQRGWEEPATMHEALATTFLNHKPSPKNPLTEAEARALTAWLTSDEALPVLDALWPVEEPAEIAQCQL